MKLLVVSSCYPFRNKEPYLRTELTELSQYFERITVIPVRSPKGNSQILPERVDVLAWPVISSEIMLRAMRMIRSRPLGAANSLFNLATSKDRGLGKNALVSLKGLALAQWCLENDIGHVHAYWLSSPATVAMIAGEVAGIPWSATAHRWDIYERNALDVKARSAMFVRAISARGARDLQERSPQLTSRIIRMPIGAVVPSESPKPARGPSFRIVCPAALVPVKGHADLIEAVARLRERGVPVECVLAGEGPLRDDLVRHIKKRSLESCVRFVGFVPQVRLHEWYCEGSVNAVVLASREQEHLMEGIPSALVEAMAHGVPVVTTNSGSIGELVDNQCGRVVTPGDVQALADALYDVYDAPFEAMARAAKAYARVAEDHDVRRQMHALSERIHS
ncbi:MAG: glycosyltransferase [Candidatus Aquilonibacter sp.]